MKKGLAGAMAISMLAAIAFIAGLVAPACAQDQQTLRAAIQSVIDNDIPGLRRAIEAGVDINGVLDERAGPSLLTTAALYHRLGMIDLLLENGADVNIQNGDGYTPLMLAARKGDLDTVEKLSSAGADLTVESADGHDALISAKESGHRDIAYFIASKIAIPAPPPK
jgi:hypothetical protein